MGVQNLGKKSTVLAALSIDLCMIGYHERTLKELYVRKYNIFLLGERVLCAYRLFGCNVAFTLKVNATLHNSHISVDFS